MDDFVIFEGHLEPSQLTGQKMPTFGSGDEALAVPVIVVRLCQFLFGLRSALGRCKHRIRLSLFEGVIVAAGLKESLFKIGHLGFGRWPRLDMRRRAKFLQQHTLAQSLGIALTGFRKIDDPVCEYFIGKVATTSKSKRYQGHFERDAMPYS